jgi:hypothetical protein
MARELKDSAEVCGTHCGVTQWRPSMRVAVAAIRSEVAIRSCSADAPCEIITRYARAVSTRLQRQRPSRTIHTKESRAAQWYRARTTRRVTLIGTPDSGHYLTRPHAQRSQHSRRGPRSRDGTEPTAASTVDGGPGTGTSLESRVGRDRPPLQQLTVVRQPARAQSPG